MRRVLDEVDPSVRASIRSLLATGEPRWPLFIHGRIGCGKTCAALALCDRVRESLFAQVRELADQILAARDGKFWRDAGPQDGIVKVDEPAIWRALDRAPLVVLDELGMRKAGDFELELLKRVLDKRAGRPTVCLSNHPPAKIGELYDARVQDRIEGGTVIHYPGETRRPGARR